MIYLFKILMIYLLKYLFEDDT